MFLVFFLSFLTLTPIFSSERVILQTYGKNNLAAKAPFQGGYINFGYWKGISLKKKLTRAKRIKSSLKLYQRIFDFCKVTPQTRILEVGCGQGLGMLNLVAGLAPTLAVGIDITPEQIERAQANAHLLKSPARAPLFLVSSGDRTPFANASFDTICSVEVAQYFPSMSRFAQECHRLLVPGGRVIITAHFATSSAGYAEIKKLLPTVAQNIDRTIPISEVAAAFEKKWILS